MKTRPFALIATVILLSATSTWAQALGSRTTLPAAAQSPISSVLGQNDSRYWFSKTADRFHAENLRNALSVDFTSHGLELRSGPARWGLALYGYGYGDHLIQSSEISSAAKANRVEFQRGALAEWYVNGPLGLEQGFTISKAPVRSQGQLLTIALQLSGNLKASLEGSGTGLLLTQDDGKPSLRYGGLSATDAAGRKLRATLALKGNQLKLQIEDAGAQYPVVIDPLVQQAKLTASDGVGGDSLGSSVSIDGDTLVVGAPNENGQGAVYVFVRPATGWANATESAKLTASDGQPRDQLGASVAISGDTVVASGGQSAYVFVKPASGWVTGVETAKLEALDAVLGGAVAISNDTIVAVGGSTAYVFLKPDAGWAGGAASPIFQTTNLVNSDQTDNDGFGLSAAVSGDTVVVGAYSETVNSNSNQGAAYVFVEPDGGWPQSTLTEAAKLLASDGGTNVYLGWSVAVEADTVVVGEPTYNGGQGAAYVYVRPATGWTGGAITPTTETARLTASDGGQFDSFGNAVAIQGGNIAVGNGAQVPEVGPVPSGAAYLFLKPPSGWATTSTFTTKMTTTDDGGERSLGNSVSISGSTVVAGAPLAAIGSNQFQGAAYIFLTSAPTITWPVPSAISYGTPLSNLQLNASASVAGTFVYNPPLDTVLSAGVQTLSATFTPADPSSYSTTTASVNLTVLQATPSITVTGGNFVYDGNPHPARVLATGIDNNGVLGVSIIVYSPGSTLPPVAAGNYNVSATFISKDNNYTGGSGSGSLTIAKADTATSITANIPSSSSAGASVKIDFTVTGVTTPTGSVTVTASTGETCTGPLAATGMGACLMTFTTTGTRTLTAVYSGDGNFNPSTSAPVSQSVTGPVCHLSTPSINFSTVYAGSITTKNITVTNSGTSPLTITGPILSIVQGGNSNEFVEVNLCPKSLAVGKSCDITVAFLAGPYYTQQTATLSIMDNEPGSPATVALSALVINPQASLSATSLSFGAQTVNTSATKTLTLKNTGTTPLTPITMAVSGTNASDFIPSSNCGGSLSAGSTCTISVIFEPAAKGARSASLKITDNAQSATQTVALSGSGK